MGDFMVSLIGAYSHEQQVTFEKAVREAIAHYSYYKHRCKFLEGRCENLEKILALKEDPYIHFRYGNRGILSVKK